MVLWICLLKSYYFILFAISIIAVALNVWPLLVAYILCVLLFVIFLRVPAELAWSQNFFSSLVWIFMVNILYSIIVYAILYYRSGLIQNGNLIEISFLQSLYFSVTTWTTLGYGDFAPPEHMQLVTSIEALSGYFSMAIFIALLALWLNDAFKSGGNRDEICLKNRKTSNNANSADAKNHAAD